MFSIQDLKLKYKPGSKNSNLLCFFIVQNVILNKKESFDLADEYFDVCKNSRDYKKQ